MAKAYPPDSSQAFMLRHRRAWRTERPGVYKVFDRQGEATYLAVNQFGVPYHLEQETCPGAKFEAACFHVAAVSRRLARERSQRDLLAKLGRAISRERRLAQLEKASDASLIRQAEQVYPGRNYRELLRLWGRQSLLKTILRYEGYAA